MTFRSLLKNALPPGLLKIFEKIGLTIEVTPKFFSTYNDALTASSPSGYTDKELCRFVYEKTILYIEDLSRQTSMVIPDVISCAYSHIGTLIAKGNTTINILDFGGACGAYYYIFRKMLPAGITIHWQVIETETMCQYAKKLETSELKFYDNIDKRIQGPGSTDLVIVSGTLQYLSNPCQTLEQLLNCNSSYIFFSRTGLSLTENNLHTIQRSRLQKNGCLGTRIPGGFDLNKEIKYPYTYISKKIFSEIIEKKYKLLYEYENYGSRAAVIYNQPKLFLPLCALYENKNMTVI